MNPSFLTVFYGISGLLVAALLVRIYFKNRTARKAKSPVVQSVAAPVVPPRLETTRPAAVMPAVPVVQEPRPATLVDPIPAAPRPETRWEPATAAAASGVAEPYFAATASNIYRSTAVPTWEDRRLLEHRGILSRTPEDALPRVLAEDVPGTDETDRTFGALNSALASLLPESPERKDEARRELRAAGYYNPHALENLSALRYALIMLAIVVFGGLLLIVPVQLEPVMVAGLVIGPMLAWALPTLHIRRKAADRVREIGRAMPDLLDMLNMCVSQGLTVHDSLKRILREFRGVYPALTQELSIVLDQARINDMHTALEAFGRRIDLPEVHSFTSLLIQTERMGTSITQALTTYSDTMRESLKQRADEKGNRAAFRLLFPTVLCLMPAVYLFLLGPAVNEMSKFFNNGGSNTVEAGASAIQRLNSQRGVNNR